MRILLLAHVVATLYLARWTLFSSQYSTAGSILFELPFQLLTVLCLCGLVVAVGGGPLHWARRHLVHLNLVMLLSLTLWTIGPVYRSFGVVRPWGELLFGMLLVGGLIVGVSLSAVRKTVQMVDIVAHEDDSEGVSEGKLLSISAVIVVIGSLPWVFSMAGAMDSLQRSEAWRSSYGDIMEVATICAIGLSAVPLLRGRKSAALVSILEAILVPVAALIGRW